ncbi:MAG: helix-turn-helix domain-containing protein [Proteobacteria bacterium]|nr:MAG: helix-turn-helix domain-containing protein [Pseudomonadota bacterium]
MPIALKTYRQLQPEDCMTVASLHQQGLGVRAIAHLLQRSPATVNRELQRNTDSSGYASTIARIRCQQRRRAARPQARSRGRHVQRHPSLPGPALVARADCPDTGEHLPQKPPLPHCTKPPRLGLKF